MSSPANDQWQAAAAAVHSAGRPKMDMPKMDMSKALAIMGFSSSRTLDPNGGHDPKLELGLALSRQMANIERRKQKTEKKGRGEVSIPGAEVTKQRDDVRILHEAYQFLSRKYMTSKEGEEEGASEEGGEKGVSSLSLAEQQKQEEYNDNAA